MIFSKALEMIKDNFTKYCNLTFLSEDSFQPEIILVNN